MAINLIDVRKPLSGNGKKVEKKSIIWLPFVKKACIIYLY